MKKEINIDIQYFKNIEDFREYLYDNCYNYEQRKNSKGYVYTYTCTRDFVESEFYPIANKIFDDNKNTWINYIGVEIEECEDEYGFEGEFNVVIYEV